MVIIIIFEIRAWFLCSFLRNFFSLSAFFSLGFPETIQQQLLRIFYLYNITRDKRAKGRGQRNQETLKPVNTVPPSLLPFLHYLTLLLLSEKISLFLPFVSSSRAIALIWLQFIWPSLPSFLFGLSLTLQYLKCGFTNRNRRGKRGPPPWILHHKIYYSHWFFKFSFDNYISHSFHLNIFE